MRLPVLLGVTAGCVVALGAAGPVSAAPQEVTAATATWGFKESFRTYLGNSGGATIGVSDGATYVGTTTTGTPPKNTTSYSWQGASPSGTFDPSSGVGEIRLTGKVTYTYPDHFINDISITNPTVVLAGDGTGTLLADASHDLYGGDSGTPAEVAAQQQVEIADLTGVPAPATGADGALRLEDITATLTAAGTTALGVTTNYPAGTVIDPITVTMATGATPAGATGVAAANSGDSAGTTGLVLAAVAVLLVFGAGAFAVLKRRRRPTP